MAKQSHIEQLIHNLCPNGVPFATLDQVCKSSMGEFVHKDKQRPDAPYPVFNGGTTNTGYYDQYNTVGPKVIISARGAAGFVNKVEGKFWAGNSCHVITIKDEDILNWKYLYYALKSIEGKIIGQQQKGGGVPAVSKTQISELSIPLPPMAIQEEIIRVLDAFEKLIKNIDDEIKERQCQYDHCREQLFEGIKGVSTKRLEEFAAVQRKRNRQHITENAYSITQSGLVPTKSFFKEKTNVTSSDTSGYYIVQHNWFVYSPSRVDVGSISYLKDEGPVIVSPIDVVFSIDTNICLPAYLLSYFFTREGNKNLLKNREGVEGTGRRNLPFEAIQEIDIPLPSIEEQKTITAKLETIEALIANLKEERDLRQQQYEYYRAKLISLLK